VVSTFVAIAALLIVLRAAGSAIGWGFQLQSPLIIGALIYLFTLMGLSFSGFFEFGTRLMSVGQGSTSGNSLLSSFMTGALATVVASPCTAPFMGTALGFALTQPIAVALLVFAFLGIGMALPFLILSWWPGLINKMPKPGLWMDRFKQFLAFPLYLSALWLLWVLGHQTDINTVIAVLIGIVMISLAIWLSHGKAKEKAVTSSHRALRFTKMSIATLLLIGAIALPYSNYQDHRQSEQQTKSWQPYTQARLDTLLSNQQSVFINLTADWCLTCLANEKLALNERFEQVLLDKNITYLKGDWTNYNAEITTLLNANNRNSVPLYLLYHKKVQGPIILPQLLTEKIVLDALNRVD